MKHRELEIVELNDLGGGQAGAPASSDCQSARQAELTPTAPESLERSMLLG